MKTIFNLLVVMVLLLATAAQAQTAIDPSLDMLPASPGALRVFSAGRSPDMIKEQYRVYSASYIWNTTALVTPSLAHSSFGDAQLSCMREEENPCWPDQKATSVAGHKACLRSPKKPGFWVVWYTSGWSCFMEIPQASVKKRGASVKADIITAVTEAARWIDQFLPGGTRPTGAAVDSNRRAIQQAREWFREYERSTRR